MGYIDHVVRRGLQHEGTMNMIKRAVHDGQNIEVPKWGIVVLVTTCIAFVLFMSAVRLSPPLII